MFNSKGPPPPYEPASAPMGDQQPRAEASHGGTMIKYNMYGTISRLNMRLHEGKSLTPALYYVDCSHLYFGDPKLFIRRGADRKAPMCGFALGVLRSSRQHYIGLGEYHGRHAQYAVYEEIIRESDDLAPSHYHFHAPSSGEKGGRSQYSWRKDAEKAQGRRSDFGCFDGQGRLVARLASGGLLNWKKFGELEVVRGLGEPLTEMLIVSALGVWGMEMANLQSFRKGYGDDGDQASKGKSIYDI